MGNRRPLVTVNALTTQLRERGAIELPADALITPAARDWLRGTRVSVRRAAPTGSSNGAPAGRADGPGAAAASAGPRVYVVGDAAAPVIQTLLPGLQRQYPALRLLPCHGHTAGLMAAVREACEGLTACTNRRAVVIVRDGADVCCVANKYPGVRAAILATPSALLSLQSELGVNLLILERERTSLQQMRAAIERFVAGPGNVAPVIAEALAVALGARGSATTSTEPVARGMVAASENGDGHGAAGKRCRCAQPCAGH